MKETKEITMDLKSEPMNEMLSRPPSWIIRSGNGLFLLIMLLLIGLTWLIEYPDEIKGEVLVTTAEPPIELSNQLYVQLKSLGVTDQQEVRKGALLAQFDNQAKAGDMVIAMQYLDGLSNLDLNSISSIPACGKSLQLGAFQESWAAFQARIAEWNSLKQDNLEQQKMTAMQREIAYRQRLQTIAGKKIQLSERDYALVREELAGSERLAGENAISRQTLNQDKRYENQAQQSVQNQQELYIQNLIQLNDLQKDLFQMQHDRRLREEQFVSEITVSITTLRNAIRDWEKSAVWIAPCDGKVLFNKHLQINRFYAANQASIVLVPDGRGYIATAVIPGEGAGKVKKGQKTFIELIDYPKTEYGMIEGVVDHITQIDKEGKYEVRIRLPHPLKTTYKKSIPLKAQLKGSVKIVTKKKRLLERFFEKIIDLIQ